MNRRWGTRLLVLTLLAAGATGAGLCCKSSSGRPYREPPPPGLTPTTIDYTDTDGFDLLFETALVAQDPVVLVQTPNAQPDWGPRLNAWVAAWNMGGKVEVPPRAVRGQVPSLTVDGESIREFRLLVEGLMDRVEDVASRQSAWWAEDRMRARRVALLRPYNLRFHRDEEKRIQLIFFNGNYARDYAGFMRSIAKPDPSDPMEWSRTFRCSECP